MENRDIYRLDQIMQKISNSILLSISEITEMAHSSKKDYQELEAEFRRLKYEATQAIERVKLIEEQLKKGMSTLKENSPEYIYMTDQLDQLKIQLAIEKEREHNFVQRRNEIEGHLKVIRKLTGRAEKLEKNFELANHLLTGNLKALFNTVDTIQSKELMGMKILETQENERQRIAREMHDGPAQSLSNLIHKTELCIKLIDKDPIRTRLELQSLKNVIRTTIDDIRRIIYNLRPMSIDDLGLVPTLERYIDKIEEETTFNIELKVINEEYEIMPIINLTLFRIVQEALNNIIKYADANNVIIQVIYNEDSIELLVKDDGVGFDMSKTKANDKSKGFGISMMKERVYLLAGQLSIDSQINQGTSYYVQVPMTLRKEEK